MKKTKRMLALLLTLCMVLSLLPVGAGAANLSGRIDQSATWADGTTIDAAGVTLAAPTASGDVTITLGGTVTMNGPIHLSGAGNDRDKNIIIQGGTLVRGGSYTGPFIIMDSASEYAPSSLILKNITLDGGAIWGPEGAKGANSGKTSTGQLVQMLLNRNLTLENATLQNNHVTGVTADGPNGGAIYDNGDKFIMTGGAILNNKVEGSAANGGAIAIVKSDNTATITGCKLIGNYAECNGGAIYSNSKYALNVGSTEITENFATTGAVYLSAKYLSLNGGATKIIGNQKTDGTAGSNVYLAHTTLGKGAGILSFHSMTADSVVGVTTAAAHGVGALFGEGMSSDRNTTLDKIIQDNGPCVGSASTGGGEGTLLWAMPTAYNVTYSLTHVSKGSSAATATPNTEFSATIAADGGYVLPTNIIVKVDGGVVPTATYTYDSTTGAILIPANKVDGNIEIIAAATLLAKYKVTYALANLGKTTGSLEGAGAATQNQIYTGTLTPVAGYKLPNTVEVKVGSTTLDASVYNAATGVITIPAAQVTGDIHIVAAAVPKQLDAKHVLTGVTASKVDGKITAGTDYSVTLTAAETYVLPDTVDVKIGGSTLTAGANTYTYTKGTGVVMVKGAAIVDNLTITANGIKTYAVTHTTDHITYTGEATARNDKDYTDKLAATGGYLLPKGITVTVGGVAIEPGANTYSYTKDNGAISIHASAITGDIHITAVPQMEVTLIVGPAIGTVIYPSPVTPPKITKVVQKNTEIVVTPTGEGGFKYISTDGGGYGPSVTPPTEVGEYKLVITIDDPKYIGSIELPFEITPKPITSTVTATNRAYDGTKNVAVSSLTLEGVETADKTLVTVTGGSEVGTVTDANVGENKPVTLTGGNYSLTGTKAKNYALTQPANPTVTITAAPYTYKVTTPQSVEKYSLPGVLVAPDTGDGILEETVPGTHKWYTTEACDVERTEQLTENVTLYCKFTPDGTNTNHVTTPTVQAVAVKLVKIPVTVTGVTVENHIYGSEVMPTGTPTVKKGDTSVTIAPENLVYTYTGTGETSYPANTTKPKEVGSYQLVVSLNDPDYVGTMTATAFQITPKPVTAAVTATERVYNGQKTVAVSTTATVSGAAYGDVLTAAGTATGTMENADAGKDKSVTLSAQTYVLAGTKAKNYTLTQPTGTVVTITPAPYTYTIADADKTREVDKLTLPETLTAPETGKGVGEETVPGSYEWFTDAGGTKKATEPLKEDSILYCKFTPTAKETVSGNKNYVDIPTIVPVTVLLNKLTVTITGELPATFTYPDPITPPTKVVVKREEKVVNPTGEYVYTFEGRIGTTYGPTIVPPTDPGKYNLTIKLIGDPDYQGESVKMPFEIKPKTLTVSVTATHKVYDGNTTVAVTAGPLVGAKPGDDVKLTGGAATGTASDKNVGTDKAVTLTGYTLGGKKAGNYTLTPPVTTVNITAAPFTYEVPTTQTLKTGKTKDDLVAPSTGTGVGVETVPGTSKWYKDPGCTTEITEPFTTEVTVYHKFVPNDTAPNKNYVGQPVTPVRVIVTEKEVVTITDPGITTEYTGVAIVDPVPTVSPVLVGDPTWEYTYTGTDGSGKAYGPSTVRPTLVGEYRVTIKVTTETQQGEASFPFQINPAPLTVPGITATGTPGETRVTLVNTGAVLTGVKAPDEGEVSLVSDKATGTVLDGKLGIDKTVTCVDYAITGEKAFCYTLTQPGYVTANITGDLRIGTVADEAYTGSPLTPKPAVWFGKLLLTPGTDYNESMTYTGNTAVGQATIEVTGKGAFAGKTAETVFQITKVTPNGTPFYEGTVKEGDTLADLHIGTGAGKRFTHPTTGTYVPGTVIWVDDKGEALPTTTPVTKGTAYRWKFTPTDGTNYEGTAGKAIPKLVGNPYIGIVVLSDAPTVGVPGANVRLVKGSTVFAETVSTVGGRFRFEAVPDGTYNIIGEKDVVGKLRTVTALVTITGGKPDLSTLILPNAEVSAVIETAPGQGKDKDNNPIEIKTPDVVVGGLETPTEEANKRITVKLTVRAKDEKTADQTAMAEIAVLKTAMAKDKTLGLVLDMDIVKRTTTISGGAPTTTTTEAITETDDLLEILIPLPQELQGKGTYIILRHHEGEGAISISESPNAAGEYLTLNSARDLITLHARKFSTYAVYSGAAPYSPDPGTGTGTKSKLVVVDAKGGKLTADPAAPATGETVTITVATEKGYFLEKLLVTGPDGVAVAFRSNGDGTYSFPMPKGRTKVTAEYKKASPANTGVAEKLITDDHILYLIGDDLGTFRPEANMNRAEVAQMFFRLMKNPEQLDKTAKLADVPAGAWYAGPVNAMVNAGIFTGYVDGSFRPEAQITRAEFVAVAARFAKANLGAVRFTDLPKEHWAFSAIATAVAYGWVDGYEDGSFKPGANITRSEVTKIVNAMLGRAADKAFVDAGNGLRLFPDADKSHWAFYEIVEATNKHNFKLVNDSETWSK